MKYFITRVLILALSAIIFYSPVFSADPVVSYQPNSYPMRDSFSKSSKEASISLNAINGLSVDPFTGAANLSFPLDAPAGRQGIQPYLNLSYSSSHPNGPLGVGWRLDLGYIERSTKDGFPRYNSSDKFIFTLNGAASELVKADSNTYYPKTEPNSFKFIFDGAYWKVKDKQGRTYYFGDQLMPGSVEKKSSNEIFRWYLVKVEDTSGNYMKIDYVNGGNGMVAGIYYTLHPSLTAAHNEIFVEFEYETIERADRYSQYRPGYLLNAPKGRLVSLKFSLKEPSRTTLIRKYVFEYKYSAISNRSLLYKITQLGSNGVSILPPVTFNYQETEPVYTKSIHSTTADLAADFNGDGFTDLCRFDKNTGYAYVELFLRGSFQPETVWITNFGRSTNIMAGDFNGDGRADICGTDSQGNYYVALSDGRKFVNEGRWVDTYSYLGPAFAGDINADGKQDLIVQRDKNEFYYYISNGKSFVLLRNNKYSSSYKYNMAGDFDGDGLIDICEYGLNSGEWSISPFNDTSVVKGGFGSPNFGTDKYTVPADINNDGLTDAVYYDYINGKVKRKIFNGNGFKDIKDLPYTFDNRNKDARLYMTDFNGDGRTDYAVSYAGNMEIALSGGAFIDILTMVNNGIGALLEMKYLPSSAFTNKRSDGTPGLPFVIPVFYQNKISDGQGNVYTTTYSYLAGLYDGVEKEFFGFAYCRVVDQGGNYVEKFFRQDKDLRGKIYKETAKDKDGKTLVSSDMVYKKKEFYPGVDFVYLEQKDDYTYESGGTVYKQARVNYEYDAYGNPARVVYFGDISVNGDEKTNVIEYAYNTIDWIVSLPSHSTTFDENNNKIAENRFYYDEAVNYTDPPKKGLLTKEEAWLYNPLTCQESWPAATYKYDSFGNIRETTNALNYTNKIEYDVFLKTYPAKTVNPLGQITVSVYDLGLGKPLTITDANNQTTTYQYDPLGRLIALIGPYDSVKYPGEMYSYNQTARPTSVTTIKRVQPLTNNVYTTYSFYDGLGRLIQTKIPIAADKSIISDVVKYDFQGRKKEIYPPYYTASSSVTYFLPDYSQPKTTFEYDCLGRVTKTVNPDRTFRRNIYSAWAVTFIDENNSQSMSYSDAYGRVIKVEEYNDNQVYNTIYAYDRLGNLLNITDNENNLTEFIYDSLGRKLRMKDPDMGTWNYEYDLLGNLVKQTDAKGQVLVFKYDALNRLERKLSLQGTSGGETILARYIYDDSSKSNSIGRLSKVYDQSGSTEYYYDKLGREIKSIKEVTNYQSSVTSEKYEIKKEYDAIGRMTKLSYPDKEEVNYEYCLEGVKRVYSGAKEYVKNIQYSASGQITKIDYGNNTNTNYTYYPDTLRLKNIQTQNPQGKIQDLNYSFDGTGNILNIQDYVNSASQSFLYDNLNRLTNAQGPYGVFTYNYDSIGNMAGKESMSFVYGQENLRPHALSYSSDGAQFSYDNNGNLLEEYKQGVGSIKYFYDLENRLIKVEPKQQEKQEMSFKLSLKPGWNLFSLPVIPKDTNILQVLKSLRFGADFDQVARYNPVTKTWEMFTNQAEFDQFSTIEYGRGYQIYITNPAGVALTLQGYLSPTASEFPITTGWNLVCYPFAAANQPVEKGLAPLTLGVDYDTVERYNTNTGQVEKYTSAVKQWTDLKQGEAYYVKALKNSKWKIPAQNSSNFTLAGGVNQSDFVYDSSGERVKKTTPAGTTVYIGGIFEKSSDGTTRKHIFMGATRICTIKAVSSQPSAISYYHSDHLGSSNVITDGNGKQVQHYEYTPYGGFSSPVNSKLSTVNYYYTGKELDSSGLYYYGARYYSPAIARFTQPDPIIQNIYDPQTLNHYSYCRNNPLIYTDPTGMAYSSSSSSFGSGWDSFTSGLSSGISTGISTISNWGLQIGSGINSAYNNIKNSQFWQGFGSSIGSGLLITGAVGLGIAALPATITGSAIFGAATWGLGIVGSIGLGFSTGMAISGNDLLGNPLSSYQRGQFAGGSLLGWGMLGAGLANESKFWNYYGPGSKSLGPQSWAVKGSSPAYGNDYVAAMNKLSAYNDWNGVRQVPVKWNEYVGGPRPAAPRWDPIMKSFVTKGGGAEYRKGGFGDWGKYFKSWSKYFLWSEN